MSDPVLAPGVAGGERRLCRRALIALAAMLAVTLVLPDKASAHILGYEADDNNNRTVTYCTSNNEFLDYVHAGARKPDGWNKHNDTLGRAAPNLVYVTTVDYPECELRIRVSADLPNDAIGSYDANLGQDELLFDGPDMRALNERWRQFVASHELGHALGLHHADDVACNLTVMREGQTCSRIIPFPGPHDGADVNRLWVDPDARVYPNTADWQRLARSDLTRSEVLPVPS